MKVTGNTSTASREHGCTKLTDEVEWRTTRGSEVQLCHLKRTPAMLETNPETHMRQTQNTQERKPADAPTWLGLGSTVKGWSRTYASATTCAPWASRLGGVRGVLSAKGPDSSFGGVPVVYFPDDWRKRFSSGFR